MFLLCSTVAGKVVLGENTSMDGDCFNESMEGELLKGTSESLLSLWVFCVLWLITSIGESMLRIRGHFTSLGERCQLTPSCMGDARFSIA